MTRYVRQGPFNTGAPPGISAARLNAIEDGVIEAFGEVKDVADYNLMVEPGLYRGGTVAANRPDDDWYVVHNLVWGRTDTPADSDEIVQVAYSITVTGKSWGRRRSGVGVWGAWQRRDPVKATHLAFSANNPQDLAGTFKNHSGGAQVFTAPRDGRYLVHLQDRAVHFNVYTWENTEWTIGGTATRVDLGGTFSAGQASGGADQNRANTHIAVFDAAAGQTITLLPRFRIVAASGSIAHHEFYFLATVVFEGGV